MPAALPVRKTLKSPPCPCRAIATESVTMKQPNRMCWIALAGLAAVGIAEAEDTANSDAIAACRAIQTDAERLACYDRVFAVPASAAAGTPLLPNAPAGAPSTSASPSLAIDDRWELLPQEKKGQFRLLPYRPVYILAAFHSSNPNLLPSSPNDDNTVTTPLDLSNTETKFQLSLKSKLWQNVIGDFSDLWFGYTQSSR